jgi:hypothetical protein
MANNFRVRDLIADNVYISENQGNVVNIFGDQLIGGNKIFSGSNLFTGDSVSINTEIFNVDGSGFFGNDLDISGGLKINNNLEVSGNLQIANKANINQIYIASGSPDSSPYFAEQNGYEYPINLTAINKKYADENLNLCIQRELSFNTNLYFNFPTGAEGTGEYESFSSNFPSGIKKISYILTQPSGYGWGVNWNYVDWLTSPPENPVFGEPAFCEFYPQGPHTNRVYGVYLNSLADLDKNKTKIVYTDGNQSISGYKIFLGEITAPNQSTGNPNALLTKALGDQLYGSGVSINTGLFYPISNPSGFITGINNLAFTTGNQTISGIKTFNNNLIVNNSGFFASGLNINGTGGPYDTAVNINGVLSVNNSYFDGQTWASGPNAIGVYENAAYILCDSGDLTIDANTVFNKNSITAPNQTITNSSSLLTKELADNLYGSNYFAITTGLSSGVDNDAIGKKVHSFTLPSGTWEFECYATLSGSVSTGSQGTKFYLYPNNTYSFYGQNSRTALINSFTSPQTSSITLTNSNLAFSLYNIANNLISACHLKGTLIINQQTEVPIFISQNIQQTGQPIYLLRGSYLKARKIS